MQAGRHKQTLQACLSHPRDWTLEQLLYIDTWLEIIFKRDPNVLIQIKDDEIGSDDRTVYSILKRLTDIVKSLLKKERIDIDIQDKYGKTALMYAVEKRLQDIVKSLLKKGAHTSLQNKLGRRAIQVPTSQQIFRLLRQREDTVMI